MRFLLALAFTCISSVTTYAEETTIRGVLPAGLAPPLLFEVESGAPKGLVADYTVALIEAMGKKPELSVVTRYRLDGYILKGNMDMLCYTSRVWATNQENLDFSKPLFMKREVLLGPSPMPKKVGDLKGKTIGTMLQYVYPKLDPLFEANKLVREDSPSEEANLKKLLNGRLTYVVTDEIFIDYFRMAHPQIEKNRERLFMQEYPISCSISRTGRVKEKDLNAAIDKIKSNGTLEAIFSKYGTAIRK